MKLLNFTIVGFISVFNVLCNPSFAYISGSLSTPEGSTSLSLDFHFERGLLGALDIPESEQTLKSSISRQEFGVGHNFGNRFGLDDVSIKINTGLFQSAEERLNSRVLYEKDSGYLLGGELSVNFIHDPSKFLGLFIRTQIPISMHSDKFSNPKFDSFGLGLNHGYEISDLVGHESLIYFGSGFFSRGRKQNASVAMSQLFSFRNLMERVTLKSGPFIEADVTERTDLKYGSVGFRTFRLGITLISNIKINESNGVEFGYIQKFSGSFFRATKDYIIGLKTVF